MHNSFFSFSFWLLGTYGSSSSHNFKSFFALGLAEARSRDKSDGYFPATCSPQVVFHFTFAGQMVGIVVIKGQGQNSEREKGVIFAGNLNSR